MEAVVQTVLYFKVARFQVQPWDTVDDLQQDDRDDKAVGRNEGDGAELLPEELPTRVSTLHAAEDADAQSSQHTSHAVDAPHVQRIVPLHLLAEFAARVAEDSSKEANDGGSPRLDVACSWSDGGQASNGADAKPDQVWLAIAEPVDADPRCERDRGRDFTVEGGVCSILIGV